MVSFQIQYPWVLFLLVFVPIILYKEKFSAASKKSGLKISSIRPFAGAKTKLSTFKPILFYIRIIALILIIIALTRPRKVSTSIEVDTDEGIDILLTVDTSLSMLTRDLKPDRLEALKEVAINFVEARITDKIGLVEYSGEGLMRVPLTTDKKNIVSEIKNLQSGKLASGTAIGVGLATAVNHLKKSNAKSKVIILLTDGVEDIDTSNNLIYVSPSDAADLAKEEGIKVYTIGIGTNGKAYFPVGYDFLGDYIYKLKPVEIDEVTLKSIAENTGGLYFRATDNESLKDIYAEIDQLEKSEIIENKYYDYKELYAIFLVPAVFLLLLESILKNTIFKELI